MLFIQHHFPIQYYLLILKQELNGYQVYQMLIVEIVTYKNSLNNG